MSGELITIIILSIVIVVLLIFIRNLLIQTEMLDDIIISNRMDTLNRITDTSNKLNEIDIRGSFASDDEVGVVFTDIKELIEKLKKEL